MKVEHPAIRAVLQETGPGFSLNAGDGAVGAEHTTSVSLARALAIGCLSRLEGDLTSVNVWDPAAGSGVKPLGVV